MTLMQDGAQLEDMGNAISLDKEDKPKGRFSLNGRAKSLIHVQHENSDLR